MSVPASRSDFKEFCLRRLGKPVVSVNVSEEQVDDCVDYALAKARDYHFDFISRTFAKVQITDDDKTNGYVIVPDNIIEIIGIFPVSATLMGVGMWNLQYQAVFTAMDIWGTLDLQGWVVLMQNLQFMQEIFSGQQQIRFSRYDNKLYIDVDWNMINTGDWIVADAYATIDPDTQTKVWGDPWLQQYTTALIKRQWGNNLSKYSGVQMPGGVVFNGQVIKEEAEEEIQRLDATLITDYSIFPQNFIG